MVSGSRLCGGKSRHLQIDSGPPTVAGSSLPPGQDHCASWVAATSAGLDGRGSVTVIKRAPEPGTAPQSDTRAHRWAVLSSLSSGFHGVGSKAHPATDESATDGKTVALQGVIYRVCPRSLRICGAPAEAVPWATDSVAPNPAPPPRPRHYQSGSGFVLGTQVLAVLSVDRPAKAESEMGPTAGNHGRHYTLDGIT